MLCCGYTLTDFPLSIRLTSLALWQSNDCPSASKANLMNMDKYFMWIHYERLHNHNKTKHNKTVCIFLGIYCILLSTKKRFSLLFLKCCKTASHRQRYDFMWSTHLISYVSRGQKYYYKGSTPALLLSYNVSYGHQRTLPMHIHYWSSEFYPLSFSMMMVLRYRFGAVPMHGYRYRLATYCQ